MMKKVKTVFLALGMFIISVFVAQPAQLSAAAAESWEQDWKKTMDAAKDEGKVTIYTTASGSTRVALTKAFTKKYGIQLDLLVGRGAETAEKLSVERRANIFTADLYIGGSTTSTTSFKPKGFLAPLKPLLILPDVTNSKLWYGGGLFFTDKERQYVAIPVLTPANSYLAINTDLVKPGDIASYKDLLNPKWKGKIIMNDPTIAGAGSRWFAVVADKYTGLDYMRHLAKQDLTITRDRRLQVEGLARGKYAIAIGSQPDELESLIKAGAPIKPLIPEEGTWLGGGPGCISYFDRAPHPSATKIFVNWLMSKEGQTVYSKAVGAQSARLDVPTDHLTKDDMRDPSVKYFISEDEEFLIKIKDYENKAKEIFGFLAK